MKKVAKTKENLRKCRCITCPSYTLGCKLKNYPNNLKAIIEGLDKSKHFEGMFCAYGRSNCLTENKGCLCEGCAVFKENNLSKHEYCMPASVVSVSNKGVNNNA